jgi:RNA polymerase sigma-70 factor, ECF subfamily
MKKTPSNGRFLCEPLPPQMGHGLVRENGPDIFWTNRPFATLVDEMTDADLVRGTLAGDREAFARLYDRYARLIRAVATDAGPSCADDVTQEVFLRAYRILGSLRAADRFAPWLVGIARHVVREARRRRPADPLPAAIPDGRPAVGDSADRGDEVARLLALVAQLPEDERTAIRLFFLAGRDVAETARLLNRSRSGTYTLIRTAIGMLARRMGADRPFGEVNR